MILPYDIDCYELGANIEPLKQDILEILHSHFTYAQLKQIFQIAQEKNNSHLIVCLVIANLINVVENTY